MIAINNNLRTFALGNEKISYIIAVNEYGYLENLYFGKHIELCDYVKNLRVNRGQSTVIPNGKNCLDDGSQFMCEIATYGQSDFREPSFSATYVDGCRLTSLRYLSHGIIKKDFSSVLPKCDGGETLEITLYDEVAEIKAHLYYTVYDDVNAIVRSVKYENCGNETVVIDRAYSFNLDIPNDNYDITRLWGAHLRERNVETEKLTHGIRSVGSKRGVTSAQFNPMIAISSAHSTQNSGEVYGFNLVYSGNYQLNVELDELDNIRINGGISAFDFSWRLEQGESLETPEIALVYSEVGFNGMSHAFHDLYRKHLINKNFVNATRPIVVNNWEATYFNFNEQKLFAIIDSVKRTGIDTFVLDDGWFDDRNDDNSSLGDWFVNDKKLPNGIKSIADYAHKNGLNFGLWFEPEMISPNSQLYREHPDWAVQAKNRVPCVGRDQYVLDLTRSDVRDFVKQTLAEHIEQDGLDYIKWDMNRAITENYSLKLPAEKQKEFAHRYVLGLYEILKYITGKYPHILIEGCSAGGCRFDAGMLKYCPQIWTSDNSDAASRTHIQYGTSFAYPLSAMTCHVSVCPNHQTGRVTPFESRIKIASLGATGYELDTTKLTEEQKKLVVAGNIVYREDEKLVLHGDLFRLTEYDDNELFAEMIVSKDKSSAKVVAMVYHPHGNDVLYRLKLTGLDEQKQYRIVENNTVVHGSVLVNRGLYVPQTTGDYITMMWHLVEQ